MMVLFHILIHKVKRLRVHISILVIMTCGWKNWIPQEDIYSWKKNRPKPEFNLLTARIKIVLQLENKISTFQNKASFVTEDNQ